MRAYLLGNLRIPFIRLAFPRGARTPDGTPYAKWVKGLPGRMWNPEAMSWDITCLGPRPEAALAKAGVELVRQWCPDPSLAAARLSDLLTPLMMMHPDRPGTVMVRPRMLGYEGTRALLGEAAVWDKTTGRFEVEACDLLGPDLRPRKGLTLPDDILAAALERRTRRIGAGVDASALARASSLEAVPTQVLEQVVAAVGDIPSDFGVTLFPYQHVAALAAAAGHRLLALEPGAGKSFAALAVSAMHGSRRLLVISPPVALTHWRRETIAASPKEVDVRILSTRKVPAQQLPLPREGAVIVSDGIIRANKGLISLIAEWDPDFLIVDESHRFKSWEAQRSIAARTIAENMSRAPRLALSGTPMTDSCVDLVGQLALTGQLDSVFGGPDAFLTTFARRVMVGGRPRGWEPRRREAARLRDILDSQVWVRISKEEAWAVTDGIDVPPLQPQVPILLDVPLTAYRAAHREVGEKVREWIEAFWDSKNRPPNEAEVHQWATDSIGMAAPLRHAAGLSKVEAAGEWVQEWVAGHAKRTRSDGATEYDRPLIVWVHHRDVGEAMLEAVAKIAPGAQAISGTTSMGERDRIIAAFQDGTVPVLVASIAAAGVGITLTRGCDSLFVERAYSPADNLQAVDRQHRVGQSRPVTPYVMIAVGTTDEHTDAVHEAKAGRLVPLMGASQDVSVGGLSGEASRLSAALESIAISLLPVVAKDRARAARTPRALAS